MRLALFLVLLVAGSAVAESVSDTDELRALLDEFLAGASVNDSAVHERFWSDDLIYTSAAGRRFGKAEILDGLRSPTTEAPAAELVYTGRDVTIQQHGSSAVITFRLVATDVDGEETHFFNTGVFHKTADQWQVVAWQATRAAEADR